MRRIYGLIFLSSVFFIAACGSAEAENAMIKSTLVDQSSVEVTVYNNELALVKDTRNISLPVGVGELRFEDVASTIQPVTVHAKSVNQPDQFSILEQNYEYDLMSESKLLDKFVGKKLKIMVDNQFQDRKEIVEAKLLSNNQGQIYQIKDEIYLGHPGIKILPEIPENLIDKPTLAWMYQNKSKTAHALELSYLASGIGWKADYILNLSKDDVHADLSGWISLNNQSGATYTNAKLKLVAGDVNRVRPTNQYSKEMRMDSMSMVAAAPQFGSEQFFEYHMYDLKRPTTIKNNQTKQVSFIESFGLGIEKVYLVQQNGYYYGLWNPGNNDKMPVNVYLKFKNSEGNKLGQPLPQGIMRLYKQDASGSLQFVGEDQIQHTPKDEEIELKIGNAFDIVAERKQLNYQKISQQMHESEWEIILRNHKDKTVVVEVLEDLGGSWKITRHSQEYKKESATQIRFKVSVPKDGETKVTYTVRVGI